MRIPGADELAVAERVLARLPFGELLYARVDLIRDAAHRPCVLELELNEPSLFLAHAPAAAEQLPRRCSPASTSSRIALGQVERRLRFNGTAQQLCEVEHTKYPLSPWGNKTFTFPSPG